MQKKLYTLLLLLPLLAVAKENTEPVTKSMEASRTLASPKIDGKINDSVWSKAVPVSDFIINSPDFGKPSKLKTKVWVLYDDAAIYIPNWYESN
jgi:acetaldehyde dehydrogenase (acetylating)